MAVSLVLGYTRVADSDAAAAQLATYTHTCGYTRAWIDPYDPLLVWLQPACPADDKITALKAAIVGMVTTHIQNSANISDPYERIQAIFARATEDAGNWVQENSYPHLAQFLGETSRLRGYIFTEMQTQGIIG